jgi:hypothetical protein
VPLMEIKMVVEDNTNIGEIAKPFKKMVEVF